MNWTRALQMFGLMAALIALPWGTLILFARDRLEGFNDWGKTSLVIVLSLGMAFLVGLYE